ncbi:MAG: hypothetical protein ACRD4O_07075, partial [Bryobacteraceae bacterium]
SYAGCSRPAMYVARDGGAFSNRKRSAITDGRIAILPLQTCTPPDNMDEEPAPKPPGDKATRLARRIILEARNYVLRENVYYWAYEMVRYRERAAQRE